MALVENLARQIGLPGTVFLLAESDGEAIATSYAALEDGSIMLRRLYVLPNAQRHGTGQALLDETVARWPGARSARLEVEPANGAAMRFYEKNGFRQVSTSSCCGDRSDLNAIVMEKVLQVQNGG